MLRFVDLTEAYWTEPEDGRPCCAFLNTVTDSFVTNDFGCHVFNDMQDLDGIENAGHRERCIALLPDGFFGGLARVPAPPIVRVVDEPDAARGEVTKLQPSRPPWGRKLTR